MTDLSINSPNRVWYEALKEESISFLKGDNNAPWAILAETAIGLVPVLGQMVDARDVIKGLVEVSDAPDSQLAWFNLITALIGLVPGGGDAAKRSMRAVKSGAANVDDLTAMIRRFYTGDPEKLLREVTDLSTLKQKLDALLSNPRLMNRLSTEMRGQVDSIRNGLDRHFAGFKREMDDWLASGRRTSAQAPIIAKQKHGVPPAKPQSPMGEGQRTRHDVANPVRPNQPNAATQRTARFKQVSNKLLGVLGEHMADYYCQDIKGWGRGQAAHDQSEINTAKLNDGHRLVQLWPCIPRGRGIDAVWKTNSGKPYAIIEAKASFNPAKTLGQLLGEAGDKNESGLNGGGNIRRKAGAGGKAGGGSGQVRQVNGKVTQMSHGWIEPRLQKAVVSKVVGERIISNGYSRHVLFFSIPHAVAHSEALITRSAGADVMPAIHAAHEVTREWHDNEIQRVINNRAGLSTQARNRAGK
ncbi:hypothetical protein NPS29_26240 [Pseudomonas putida]|uniref:hypothetical protein n=1 Tax=Pseudomonas putida TaxID=303 RepID=UPI00236337E2|nr:hypothetical protein [Pseudomonas putida]MDD1968838.1 hypothetical protein [Pseudomonas putida]